MPKGIRRTYLRVRSTTPDGAGEIVPLRRVAVGGANRCHLSVQRLELVPEAARHLQAFCVEGGDHPRHARGHALRIEEVITAGRLHPCGPEDRAGRVQDEVDVREVRRQDVPLSGRRGEQLASE